MKQKSTQKRTYWSFLCRIFAMSLAAAVVIASIVVIIWKTYAEYGEQASDLLMLSNLENWLNDPNNTDPSEAEIRKRLAAAAANDYWTDCGILLYDRKEQKTYDSSKLLWAYVSVDADRTKLISELEEAAKQYPETLRDGFHEDGSFSKYFISEDPDLLKKAVPYDKPFYYFYIVAEDIYAQGDTLKLGLFDVHGHASARRKIIRGTEYDQTYNLSYETRSSGSYVHFRNAWSQAAPTDDDTLGVGFLTLHATGSREGSPALAEAYRFMNWNHDDYSINPPGVYSPDIPFGYAVTTFYSQQFPTNKLYSENYRWELYAITYYSFFTQYALHFRDYGIMLLVLLLILSAVVAKFRHMKYCKAYEMDEYRRSLTAALAHDLKSPLTAISGYAENLRENVHTEKRDDYADAILENTQYMDNLIADVLELAKLEQKTKIKTAHTDPVQLAKEAAARRAAATEEKEITVQLSGRCEISANEKMMAQAIANLIDNAVRYTPRGGCIDITGTEQELQIRNDIEAAEPAEPDALCEPFVKGDAARGTRSGSGMGLAIVKQICALHGFRLSVSAKDGKFTAAIRFK